MGIWVDTDMGVDDLFAVLLTLQHTDVDGMSLVFGNAPLEYVKQNTAGAVQQFDWKFSIFSGAECALLGGVQTAQNILGATGMPSRGECLPTAEGNYPAAQVALCDWLDRQTNAEILALGPLTNLAILALTQPGLLANISKIIWMGGGITRGNHTASAEFNALADPEALAVLLARDVVITMIDLDACRKVEIIEEDITALKSSQLMKDLLGGYLDIALSRQRPAMALYDPVAAAALVAPSAFQFAPARIEVELAGNLTRGRTVVDQRDPKSANALVVQDLDAERVKSICLSALKNRS